MNICNPEDSQTARQRVSPAPAIDVVVPGTGPRGWHRLLIERLRADGHDVAVRHGVERGGWTAAMRGALAVERRIFRRPPAGLATRIAPIDETPPGRPAELSIDLRAIPGKVDPGFPSGIAQEKAIPGKVDPGFPSGIAQEEQHGSLRRSRETRDRPGGGRAGPPLLQVVFDGTTADAAALATLARGRLPEIEIRLDGRPVGRAWPMVDKPESVALGADDVFARAVTLVRAFVRRFGSADAAPVPPLSNGAALPGFAAPYISRALPRLGREAIRRARFRKAHWRVGYRFIETPGVAATGVLGGGWSVLPDDGTHFYADPFPFEWEGRHHIFVEDFDHAADKASISVVIFDAEGHPAKPVRVLEEPHHLSYPQVFARDGAVWMLPEGSASARLTLYRATDFPHGWTESGVLIDNREISDATLFEHGGRLWLFATDRDGYGSTSDTLVVYHAERLEGPWIPHPMNPVAIDRRAARPGGAVAMVDGRPLLPLQDGTTGYGGGLGLAPIRALDTETVRLGRPEPVRGDGDFPYPRVHTLNRAGRLEVIDGIAAVRR